MGGLRMVPQSGSQGFMVPEQRHILLLLLEIYNAITLHAKHTLTCNALETPSMY
jgi:hypothetical protein